MWLAGALASLGASVGSASPLTGNGTQPGLTNPLSATGDCSACHGDYDSTNHIEPHPTWAGSLMAQAGRDPLFWASLDVANHDIPGVGDFCLRCHAPSAWLAGRSEPPNGSTDGCKLIGKLDDPAAEDFNGVGCDFCHRMKENPSPPAGQLAFYLENGQFWLDEASCFNGPCKYGPYDYPKDGASEPPHAWAFSSYHEESRFCGTCHNVTHPTKNLIEGGTDTGKKVPVERTYREWELSDYAVLASTSFKTCQNCHMPDATVAGAKAALISTNTHTGDLPIHELAGGNAWIPDVLRQAYPSLGIDKSLLATRDAALDMLQKKSATLELTTSADVNAGEALPVQVKITNLTGHKLPTGYPEGRRMWLALKVVDAADTVVFESGAYDASTGKLDKDAQIKVYEAKVGIWNKNGKNQCDVEDASGKPLFHFVLNDCVLSDNRIPPKGFIPDAETKPVGYTYPETSPGSGVLVSYDVTSYSVPIPTSVKTPLTVTATLRYQTTSKEYVEFLRDQAVTHSFPNDCIDRVGGKPTKSRGQLLYDLWQSYGRSPPVTMATGSADVTVAGAAGTGGAAGAAGTGGVAGSATGGTPSGGTGGGSAGAGGAGQAQTSDDDGGCGCRATTRDPRAAWLLLGLLGLGSLGRRRRARERH